VNCRGTPGRGGLPPPDTKSPGEGGKFKKISPREERGKRFFPKTQKRRVKAKKMVRKGFPPTLKGQKRWKDTPI